GEALMDYRKTRCISYFDLGEHTIRVEVSTFSGKEEVFVNDQCVSSKRSFRLKTVHEFVLDDQAVKIIVHIKNIFTNPMVISFYVNDVLRDTDDLNQLNQELAKKNWINYDKYGQERPWWFVVGTIALFFVMG